jgi:hypothetical protein
MLLDFNLKYLNLSSYFTSNIFGFDWELSLHDGCPTKKNLFKKNILKINYISIYES